MICLLEILVCELLQIPLYIVKMILCLIKKPQPQLMSTDVFHHYFPTTLRLNNVLKLSKRS